MREKHGGAAAKEIAPSMKGDRVEKTEKKVFLRAGSAAGDPANAAGETRPEIKEKGAEENGFPAADKNAGKSSGAFSGVPGKILLVLAGAGVGLINGLLGGGGGMLVVPVLIYLLKTDTKQAHATAILIILPISVFSSIIYLLNGHLPFPHSLFGIGGVVAGGTAGALLLKKFNGTILKLLFAALMIAAGVMSAI